MLSHRDLRESYELNTFTGRVAEVQLFEILLNSTTPLYSILNLHGVGGVGKSTLMIYLKNTCRNRKVPMAFVDIARGRGVIETADIIREQLNVTGHAGKNPFQNFEKALTRLRDQENRLRQALVSSASQVAIEGTRAAGSLVGGPLGGLAATAITAIGEDQLSSLINRVLPQREADFYIHAEEHLTGYLIEGLNELAKLAGRVVLLFDTYEVVNDSFDKWLCDTLLDNEADLSAAVLVVVAGRDPLDRQHSRWRKWHSVTRVVEIQPFQPREADTFLRTVGIVSDDLRAQILKVSEPLPWHLALVAELVADGRLTVDMLATGVHKRLIGGEVVSRFLQQVSSDQLYVRIIEVCAIVRYFNTDIISVLLETSEGVDNVVRGLRRYSFVRLREDGNLALHEIVAEYIVVDLRQRSEHTWRILTERAIRHFEQQAGQAALFSTTWQECQREGIYHRLRLDEASGREHLSTLFDLALTHYQYELCEKVLGEAEKICRVAEHRLWLEQHRAELAFYRLNYQEAERILHSLLANPLTDKMLAMRANYMYAETIAHFARYSQVSYYYEYAASLARELGEQTSNILVRSLWGLSEAKQLQGEIGAALIEAQEALSIADQASDKYMKAKSMRLVAQILRVQGSFSHAKELVLNYISLLEDLKSEADQGHALCDLASIYLSTGDLDDAWAAVKQGAKIADKWERADTRESCLSRMASLNMLEGKCVEAETQLQECLQLCRDYGVIRWVGYRLLDLCDLYIQENEFNKARIHLDEAMQIAAEHDYHDQLAHGRLLEGHLLLNELLAVRVALEAVSGKYVEAMCQALQRNRYLLDEIVGAIEARLLTVGAEEQAEITVYLCQAIIDQWSSATLDGRSAVEVEQANRELEKGDGRPQLTVIERFQACATHPVVSKSDTST
ncbi:hypothetical protein ANRL4_02413 [Anaerolineae bacterium]|nr:hypothetical protein ANRL4_02413 [Anaerolineae bacterium]